MYRFFLSQYIFNWGFLTKITENMNTMMKQRWGLATFSVIARETIVMYLTLIFPVDPSILINWMSTFPVLGVPGELFSSPEPQAHKGSL